MRAGPYAFLGTGWVGCEPDNGVEGGGNNQTYERPAEVDVDYGTPLGLCKESKPGVFTREYVQFEVNTAGALEARGRGLGKTAHPGLEPQREHEQNWLSE